MKQVILVVTMFLSLAVWCGEPTPLEVAKELAWKIGVNERKLESDMKSRTTRPGEDASNTPEIADFRDRGAALHEMKIKLDKIIKDNKLNRADVNKVFEERKAEVKTANDAAMQRWLMEEKIRGLEARNRANGQPLPPKRIGE